MMSSPLWIIVGGCLLGAVQLAAGVALGLWLRRGSSSGNEADLRRAHAVALKLHGLTHQIGDTVSLHRERLAAVDQQLQSQAGKNQPTTDLVVGVIGEILKANRQLQQELQEAEAQIAEQTIEVEAHLQTALTDPLTKLPNRRALNQQLTRRIEDYRKQGTPFSLMLVDLDHFKQINDTFGHPVGDEVLQGWAAAVSGSLRRHDFVARYGGEEFALILPYTTLKEAQRAAGKAGEGIATLSQAFAHLNRPITSSGGLASIEPSEDAAKLIKRADQALYAAKQGGRNCIYLHDGQQCRPLDADLSGRDWGDSAEPTERDALAEESPKVTPARSEDLIDACGDLKAALQEITLPKPQA